MISCGTPKAKAVHWGLPDSEMRKRGEQKGLCVLLSYKTYVSARVNTIRCAQISRQNFGTRRGLRPKFCDRENLRSAHVFTCRAFHNKFYNETKTLLEKGGWEKKQNPAGYAGDSPFSMTTSISKLGYIGKTLLKFLEKKRPSSCDGAVDKDHSGLRLAMRFGFPPSAERR